MPERCIIIFIFSTFKAYKLCMSDMNLFLSDEFQTKKVKKKILEISYANWYCDQIRKIDYKAVSNNS